MAYSKILADTPLRLVDNKRIFQPSLYLSINKLRRKKTEKWWMGDKNAKVYYITLFTFYSFPFPLQTPRIRPRLWRKSCG
jgi:hypothetical protein